MTACCEGVAAYLSGAAWDVLHDSDCAESPNYSQPRRGDWMQTYTGRAFWPLDPRPDDIDPRDIAHALSQLCRFGGHTRTHYSVAEHCWHISHAVPAELALWGLLHDATEAYLVDLPRPIKRHMPDYREAEARVMAAIAVRFDLPFDEPAAVKDADNRILLDERAALLGPMPLSWGADLEALQPLGADIRAWSWRLAECMYLDRLEALGVTL